MSADFIISLCLAFLVAVGLISVIAFSFNVFCHYGKPEYTIGDVVVFKNDKAIKKYSFGTIHAIKQVKTEEYFLPHNYSSTSISYLVLVNEFKDIYMPYSEDKLGMTEVKEYDVVRRFTLNDVLKNECNSCVIDNSGV